MTASLGDLEQLAVRLRTAEETVTEIRAERVTMYRELLGAGVTMVEVAKAAGVSEPAVHATLKKAAARSMAAATGSEP